MLTKRCSRYGTITRAERSVAMKLPSRGRAKVFRRVSSEKGFAFWRKEFCTPRLDKLKVSRISEIFAVFAITFTNYCSSKTNQSIVYYNNILFKLYYIYAKILQFSMSCSFLITFNYIYDPLLILCWFVFKFVITLFESIQIKSSKKKLIKKFYRKKILR